MQGDLTSLAAVKAWLNTSTTNEDALTARLISSVSQVIRNWCQRDTFLSQTYTDIMDGNGAEFMLLRQFPVTAVSALSIGSSVIPAATGLTGPGYRFDQWNGSPSGRPAKISVCGWRFWEGNQNVSCTYQAGYLTSGDVQTIPNDSVFRLTPVCPNGIWGGDVSVSYATGGLLVPVAANPTTGQYVPPNPFGATNVTGYYQFAAGDVGKAVVMDYSFVPPDLENCTIELCGERLSYRKRIGERSHSSGGQQTVSFNITDFPPWAESALRSYRSMVPL